MPPNSSFVFRKLELRSSKYGFWCVGRNSTHPFYCDYFRTVSFLWIFLHTCHDYLWNAQFTNWFYRKTTCWIVFSTIVKYLNTTNCKLITIHLIDTIDPSQNDLSFLVIHETTRYFMKRLQVSSSNTYLTLVIANLERWSKLMGSSELLLKSRVF